MALDNIQIGCIVQPMQMLDGIQPGIAGPFPAMAPRQASPTSLPAVAERLRLLREAHRMNQVAWCKLIEVAPTAWNNYERAQHLITVTVALKVCTATGASLDYIYRGEIGALPHRIVTAIQALEKIRA
jgi:DNA-binding XRE family transcriptional regulator